MGTHTFQHVSKKRFQKMSPEVKLGYQIFKARKAAGMTQRRLANAIGTRQGNISRMEVGGYNFTIEILKRIAKALNADLQIELK